MGTSIASIMSTIGLPVRSAPIMPTCEAWKEGSWGSIAHRRGPDRREGRSGRVTSGARTSLVADGRCCRQR
eukprot:6322893-Prymnesium_polylepis.1